MEFISSHFYEIDKEKVQNLDANLIEEIIKSDKLELEDEDYSWIEKPLSFFSELLFKISMINDFGMEY